MARYAGQTAAERAAARRERLLAAGLELVGQGRWPALSVRGVCERANLTARYFYESFRDRDALAAALFDAVAAVAAEAVLTSVLAAGPSAHDKATAAIGAFVDLIADDPARANVLFGEAPELTERRLATTKSFANLVAAQARDFYEVPAGEDALVQTTAAMLTGGLAATLLAWTDGTLETTRAELVEHCAVLFVAAGEAAAARARML